jgi:hypothetical protein
MANEMQWSTVQDGTDEGEETKIIFDSIGDEFIGKYLGPRVLEDENGRSYTQLRFEVEGDGIYFTNAGFSLRQAFRSIRPGTLVRVEFSSETDTGRESAMKSFTVQVARRAAGTAAKVSENS